MNPPEQVRTQTSFAPWALKDPIAPGLLDRVVSSLVKKGSLFPFNKIPPMDGGGGDRLRLPYAQSPWVMRAIKKIAGPITAVGLLFSSVKRGSDQILNDPAIDAFWQRPVRNLTYTELIDASIGWWKLRGEFFWLMDDSMLVPFPEARTAWPQFIVARPDRMKEIVRAGRLEGWRFTDGDGRTHLLVPDQVIHVKAWNPYNDWRGLAEYEAAEIAAEADYLAGKFNLNLMRNNGDRGPYIVAKGGIPDDTQRAQIIQQLREKKELALRGQFRPVFLTGDITVEDPKVQTMDAAMVASRLQNRHEVYIALGVPPSMADKMESYSIGSASDWYMLIVDTCIPSGNLITDAIEKVTTRMRGSPTFAWLNWDEHPVMQAVRRERFDAGTKLWDRGMPWEAVSEYLDLGMQEFDGWDIGYIPFGLAPVGSADLTPPAADQQFQEPTDNNAGNAMAEARRAIRAKQLGLVAAVCDRRSGDAHRAPLQEADENFQENRPKRELSQWQTLMAKRKPVIKAYENAFNRMLMKARTEVLRKLDQFKRGGGTSSSAAPVTLQATLASPDKQIRVQRDDFGNLVGWDVTHKGN